MAKLKEIIGEELFNKLPQDKQKEYESKNLEDISNGAYIPKDRFDQVNDNAKEYKKQLDERDKQLNDLQGKVKDNDDLIKEIEALKIANTTTAADYEKKLQQIQYDVALNNALKDSKAKDINLIKALLDKDKLKVDGDNVIGLKEQLEVIKKDKDYLFEKEINGTGSFGTGGNGNSGGGEVKSLGERLAKEKSEQLKPTETIDKFFNN